MHLFQRDCKSKFGYIFTQTNVISKRKKIEIPDWRQMKVVFKGFKTVKDFNQFVGVSMAKTSIRKCIFFKKFVQYSMSQSGSGLQRLESLDNRVSHFLVSDGRGSDVHRLCVRGSSQRSRARHHKKPLSGFLQKGHRLGVDR